MASQADIEHQQTMLKIHRGNSRVLQNQIGLLGAGGATLGQANQLELEINNIDQTKKILRKWGVKVDNYMVDTYDFTPFGGVKMGEGPEG